jgi:hypothetical protein
METINLIASKSTASYHRSDTNSCLQPHFHFDSCIGDDYSAVTLKLSNVTEAAAHKVRETRSPKQMTITPSAMTRTTALVFQPLPSHSSLLSEPRSTKR